MKLIRNMLLSLEILASHKVRTSLSLTGIVVGVGAVVLMGSLGRGAQQRILGRIRAMGTNLIVVSAGKTQIVAGRQRQMTIVTTLVPDDASQIMKQCPSVELAAAATRQNLAIRWESENAMTSVVGMSADGFRIRNITAASGRLFDSDDGRVRRRVAVVGPTVVQNLFDGTDPVGLTIRIGKVPFEVIGVSAPKGTDVNGADQDDLILVPLETALRRLLNVTYVQTIYAQARSSEELNLAEKEIRQILRQRHRLGSTPAGGGDTLAGGAGSTLTGETGNLLTGEAGDTQADKADNQHSKPDDFTIQNQATLLEAEGETMRSMMLLIGSVAGISLMVGIFGIMAVMTISVRERRQEIGLRRAVGASRQDIRNQFLAEATILSTIGGLSGVLLGIGITYIVATLGYWDALISWPAAVAAMLFSLAAGLVFGIYPAARAAALEPIQALRAE
jgi:putative ABC transport system permease protein